MIKHLLKHEDIFKALPTTQRDNILNIRDGIWHTSREQPGYQQAIHSVGVDAVLFYTHNVILAQLSGHFTLRRPS